MKSKRSRIIVALLFALMMLCSYSAIAYADDPPPAGDQTQAKSLVVMCKTGSDGEVAFAFKSDADKRIYLDDLASALGVENKDNINYLNTRIYDDNKLTLVESDGIYVKIAGINGNTNYKENPSLAFVYGSGSYAEVPVYMSFTEVAGEISNDALIVGPRAIENLVYSGSEQALIEEGITDIGDMEYKLYPGGKSWSAEGVPEAKEAGDYTVYWRVVVGSNPIKLAEGSVDVTISPARNPLKVTAEKGLKYTGEPQGLVKVDDELEQTVEYYVNGNSVGNAIPTATEAGEYRVFYRTVNTDPNYRPAMGFVDVTIEGATVEPGQITITVNNWEYGETPILPTVIMSDGVSDEEFTYTYYFKEAGTQQHWEKWTGRNAPRDAGTYKIKVVGTPENENYTEFSVVAEEDLEISQAKVKPVIYIDGWTVNDSPNEPYFRNRSDYAKHGRDLELKYEYKSTKENDTAWKEYDPRHHGFYPEDAGEYLLKLTVSSDNYAEATSDPVEFVIAPKEAGVKTAPVARPTLVYDSKPHYLLENPGEAENGTIYYCVSRTKPDPIIDSEGVTEWSTNVPIRKDAGIYSVWYMVVSPDDDGNYKNSEVLGPRNTMIEPKPVKITWNLPPIPEDGDTPSFTYDGTPQKPTAYVTEANGRCVADVDLTVRIRVEGYNADGILYAPGKWKDAGSYVAHAMLWQKGDEAHPNGWLSRNYVIAEDENPSRDFDIIARDLRVMADRQKAKYGDPLPKPTYQVDTGSDGLLPGDEGVISGHLAYEDIWPLYVGKYPIGKGTLKVKNGDNGKPNYNIVFWPNSKLIIYPRPLTVTSDSDGVVKVYGDPDPEEYGYTTDGWAYFDQKDEYLKGKLSREEGEDVGTYAITQGDLDIVEKENSLGEMVKNYRIVFDQNGKTLTITPKPVHIKWITDDDYPKCVYNGGIHYLIPTITGAIKGELLLPEISEDSEVLVVDAGDYNVKVTGMTAGTNTKTSNYELKKPIIPGSDGIAWSVAKAKVNLKADDKRKAVGEKDPELTYSVTSGQVFGDDILNVSLARKSGETAGNYAITVTPGTNKNYDIVKAEAGTFTIYDPSPGPGPGPGPGPSPTDDVQKVIDMINALPNLATADDASQVQAARDAYDKLSPADQAKVTNYQKLVDAEAQVKTSEDQKAADEVSALIDKLPVNPEEASEAEAQAAFAAYRTLTPEQKELLSDDAKQKVAAYKYYYEVKYAKAQKATLKSVKAKKNQKATAKWAAVSAVDGYQLYYKAKGTKAKKVSINNASTVTKTVKKLKAGKVYTFKVRTMTEIYNPHTGKVEKQYGKWSNKKKAKAKK